jgi:hypothetical protein
MSAGGEMESGNPVAQWRSRMRTNSNHYREVMSSIVTKLCQTHCGHRGIRSSPLRQREVFEAAIFCGIHSVAPTDVSLDA